MKSQLVHFLTVLLHLRNHSRVHILEGTLLVQLPALEHSLAPVVAPARYLPVGAHEPQCLLQLAQAGEEGGELLLFAFLFVKLDLVASPDFPGCQESALSQNLGHLQLRPRLVQPIQLVLHGRYLLFLHGRNCGDWQLGDRGFGRSGQIENTLKPQGQHLHSIIYYMRSFL